MATITQLEQPAPSAIPSLRANFSWTFAGNAIYALCQWAMLCLLAKIGSPATVGQFALALAISAPIFMLGNLQLRSVQATDARSEYSFGDYFTLRFLTTTTAFAGVCIFFLRISNDWTTRELVLLLSLAKAFECFSDVVAGFLQRQERLDRAAVSLIVRGVLSLLVFGVVLVYSRNVVMATASMALTWLTVLLLCDIRWANAMIGPRETFFNADWKKLKRLSMLALPLGLVMALISLNTNIPRYVLQHYLGSAELGIFASLAYALTAINLIVNAIGQSVSTRLSQLFARGELQTFRSVVWKLARLGVLFVVFGVPLAFLIGRPVLTLLYRREYGENVGLFALMVAAAGVSTIGSFLGYGMLSARCFQPQLSIVGASTLTTAIASLILVPQYGVKGAAVALLLSAFVMVFGCWISLRRALVAAEEISG
jgi:O-antigen/teichoic acid export membrane protein